jgi:hypothetical protein
MTCAAGFARSFENGLATAKNSSKSLRGAADWLWPSDAVSSAKVTPDQICQYLDSFLPANEDLPLSLEDIPQNLQDVLTVRHYACKAGSEFVGFDGEGMSSVRLQACPCINF